jgi:hypothetical protein
MEPKTDDQLHSFPYEATIDGMEHHYRITQDDNKYGIEQDGILIAEIAHGEKWRQVSGKPLGTEFMDSICDHIEAHYG